MGRPKSDRLLASPIDPSNLITIRRYYSDGDNRGKLYSVQRPDGTMTFYEYNESDSGKTNIVYTGEPDSNKTAIVDGTRSVSVNDENGMLRYNRTYDIETGLLVDETWYAEYDERGKLVRTVYYDGTSSETSYGCCYADSRTDRNGVTTIYGYDELGRLEWEERLDMTTWHEYDANDQEVKTWIVGTNGEEIVTSRNRYNKAGQLTHSWDAEGRLTKYKDTYSQNGGKISTTTYNDGSTRVETYASDGTLIEVGGTAAHPERYRYGVENNQPFNQSIRVGDGGEESEWVRNIQDFAGRSILTVYPDKAKSENIYNKIGQLIKTVDPDAVTTLYKYNKKGEQSLNAIDLNQNDEVEYDTDYVTVRLSKYMSEAGTIVRENISYAWTNNTPLILSQHKQALNAQKSWSISDGQTNMQERLDISPRKYQLITTRPDGTKTVQNHIDARLQSVTEQDTLGNALKQTTYAYDAFGRISKTIDARNGATTNTYYNDRQLKTVTLPPATNAATPQTTMYIYDNMGRIHQTIHPDTGTVTRLYYPTGELKKESGARTYTTEYTYDSQGRLKTLLAGTGTTTWNYDPQRGHLTSKIYADGKGPGYTYTPAGRLKTRKWARGITTTYHYNNAGKLEQVEYSDDTPDIHYTHNTLGQIQTITDAVGTRTLNTSPSGRPLSETINDHTLIYGYDAYNRRQNITLKENGTPLFLQNYSYQPNTSRLLSIDDGTGHASQYQYLPNSSLINTLTHYNDATPISTTSNIWDHLNRRTQIVSLKYTYNNANQRTRIDLPDGSYWKYSYDDLGQIKTAQKHTPSNTLQYDYDYSFDTIGNRTQHTDPSGTTTYTPNPLNQYTALSSWPSVLYDDDGNLTNDGIWTYTWNAENRIIAMSNATQQLEFTYDYSGRRISKTADAQTTHFYYDGWNLICEVGTAVPAVRKYHWGLDLSGTLQGAGGVGGLLFTTQNDTTTRFYQYDANGNVTGLLDETGSHTATYEYAPFGKLIAQTPDPDLNNPYTFSTKYLDNESGFYYYGFRYYSPDTGRWLNRDPIGEMGGLNLYESFFNNPLYWIDRNGLENIPSNNNNEGWHTVKTPVWTACTYTSTEPNGDPSCGCCENGYVTCTQEYCKQDYQGQCEFIITVVYFNGRQVDRSRNFTGNTSSGTPIGSPYNCKKYRKTNRCANA